MDDPAGREGSAAAPSTRALADAAAGLSRRLGEPARAARWRAEWVEAYAAAPVGSPLERSALSGLAASGLDWVVAARWRRSASAEAVAATGRFWQERRVRCEALPDAAAWGAACAEARRDGGESAAGQTKARCLAQALWTGGVRLEVPAGGGAADVALSPERARGVFGPFAGSVVRLGAGAALALVAGCVHEVYAAAPFEAPALVAWLSAGARIRVYAVDRVVGSGVGMRRLEAHLGARARAHLAAVVLGGRPHRGEIALTLCGQDAQGEAMARVIASGGSHEVRLDADHLAPDGESVLGFGGVAGADARVFVETAGRVRPGAVGCRLRRESRVGAARFGSAVSWEVSPWQLALTAGAVTRDAANGEEARAMREAADAGWPAMVDSALSCVVATLPAPFAAELRAAARGAERRRGQLK